jgi:soluble lytic murein transglycosylase
MVGLLTTLPLTASAFFAEGAGDRDVQRKRDLFLELRDAARRGDDTRFDRLRAELSDYPLVAYADYDHIMARLRHTAGADARAFVATHSDSPLGIRFLGQYLHATGRERRWGDLLAAAEREPNNEKLRCYYARAKRGRGHEDEAWALAERLFLSPSSVDKACDPLFDLWKRAGGPDDDLVWARARLAFAAREAGLLRYVASLGGPKEALDALLRAYRDPQRTVALASGLDPAYRAEVTVLGLERYSRYAPARALELYLSLPDDALDVQQKARVEAAIALRGLIERDETVGAWAGQHLRRWGDDRLTELRLRWAIGEEDWTTLAEHLDDLTQAGRSDGAWRYWRARVLEEESDTEGATSLLESLSRERSYYGFLAADRLGRPYRFGESPLAALPEPTADRLPPWLQDAAWRVHELDAIGEPRLAHAEWTHALRRSDRDLSLTLARLAEGQGWYRFAIDAANAGQGWDHLALRFPLAYSGAFEERARRQNLMASELMAIARRESAFFPSARSPAGARGLMQLMPSTGIAVARSTGLQLDVQQLYEVDHNLELGSAYYRQLLDRFEDNRTVALAAYNAGPNRVQHWLGRDLPVDAWIETIPYRETRDYVKAVLAYSVVFDHRMGRQPRLLTDAERRARY